MPRILELGEEYSYISGSRVRATVGYTPAEWITDPLDAYRLACGATMDSLTLDVEVEGNDADALFYVNQGIRRRTAILDLIYTAANARLRHWQITGQ